MITTGKRNRGGQPAQYVGRVQGRLTVVECVEPSQGDANEGGRWLCNCECGREVTIKGIAIRHKSKLSYGCLIGDSLRGIASSRRKPKEVTYTVQYGVHRNSGKRDNRGYLDKDTWMNMVTNPCHYCGEIDIRNNITQPSQRRRLLTRLTEEEIKAYEVPCNGIDRMDSSKGYEVDNCVPCCAMCNYMKLEYSQEDFIRKCGIIYARHAYRDCSLESYLCN